MNENAESSRMNSREYYENGLSSAQAEERIAQGLINKAEDITYKTTKEIVRENVFTYFNLIFAILAVLLALAGSFRNLTFLPIIAANTIIGIVQEIRAKKILDDLNMMNSPKTNVIRDGKQMRIPTEELVKDDIVVLSAGNQVGADGIVVEGEVQVNESLLTGESDEITKKTGDELMSGSFIVSGSCCARLEKVGAESYLSKLTAQAKKVDPSEQSEMVQSIDRIVKVVGILIIPMGILLFIQSFWKQDAGFSSSITSMVAAILGMIPEGLYLLTTLTLTLSAMKLASRKVLLHDMKCIETLARVDVLCVDKTGTITENEMKVNKVLPASDSQGISEDDLTQLLTDFTGAMDADNSTMAAMKKYFKGSTQNAPIQKKGFSSVFKYSCAEFESGVYVLGAPEFILMDEYEKCRQETEEYTAKGMRVLAFGRYDEKMPEGKLQKPVIPLAYIMLMNPIRTNARDTFRYFAEQGVEIKVISGDNPVTVSAVAQEAGIKGAENYIDASEIQSGESSLKWIHNTVFGRVTPERKREIIQALKRSGKTVAMTGDGVNDILALKEADCSVAMASGSEAAAQVAQMVLLESDFSNMPEIVLEGRRVVNNIQRSAILFLTKNMFSFALALISLLAGFAYPLQPNQVSLISMFTIGIPGFLLAQEPNKRRISGSFIGNVIKKALPGALTDVIAVASLVYFGAVFEIEGTDISTAATILMAIVGFMILYRITEPMNTFRIVVILGCIIACIVGASYFDEWFAIYKMSARCIMLFTVFAIATESVFRCLTKCGEWISQLIQWIEKKTRKLRYR